MKAMTLWRPWPSVIFHPDPELRKTIENRVWKPPASILGKRLAIHAGKRWDQQGAEAIEEFIGQRYLSCITPDSVIVGIVTVVRAFDIDVHGAQLRMGFDADDLVDSPWAFGPWCWVLEAAIALPEPIPCRGAQGLWTVPENVEAAIHDQTMELTP